MNEVPRNCTDHARDEERHDATDAPHLRDGTVETAGMIVKSRVLDEPQDPHQQVAKEARRYAGQDDGEPERRCEASLTVVGDVGLLHRTATRGDAALDKWLRYSLPFTFATRLRHASSPSLAKGHRSRAGLDVGAVDNHDNVTRTSADT